MKTRRIPENLRQVIWNYLFAIKFPLRLAGIDDYSEEIGGIEISRSTCPCSKGWKKRGKDFGMQNGFA